MKKKISKEPTIVKIDSLSEGKITGFFESV